MQTPPTATASDPPLTPGVVIVDGQPHPADAPVLRADDRGFLYGDGTFETIRVLGGRAQWLDRHLDRLRSGLEILSISPPSRARLAAAVRAVVTHNPAVPEAAVRLCVSRGAGGGPRSIPARPTVVAAVRPLGPTLLRRRAYSALRSVPGLHRVLPRVKSLAWLPSVLALTRVAADEEPLFVRDDAALEGATTNVFVLRGRRLLTPPLDDGVLPGLARGLILERAARLGLDADEAPLPLADLHTADGVLVSNALLPVAPVDRVDGRRRPVDAARAVADALRPLLTESAPGDATS